MFKERCFDAPQRPFELHVARINLTEFIRARAEETKAELGFGWRPSVCVPVSFDAVTQEFRACAFSGLPMRVSSLHCGRIVYLTPEDEHAFRYLHSTRHVRLQAGFDLGGELRVASCHLAQLKRAGFGAGSIEFRLLYADTVGQAIFAAEHRCFPADRLRFALRGLASELPDAIAAERRAGLVRAR